MIKTRRFWIFRVLPLIGVGVIALSVIPADLSAAAKLATATPSAATATGFKSVPHVSPTVAPALDQPRVTKASLVTTEDQSGGKFTRPWANWRSLPAVAAPVAPTRTTEAAGLTPARVGQSGVNVRSGPSGTAAKLFALPPGAAIKIGETTNGWVHVYASGTDGWIYSTFLSGQSPDAPAAATQSPRTAPTPGKVVRIAGHVTLRDAPDGLPVYDLQPGERVKIAESDGKWLRVLTVTGDTGWVLTH